MFEGLPLVAIEAMACGCLVVISDLPGLDGWMPEGLCEEGWVKPVPMPRLIGLDTPHPDDVSRFVDDLAAALTVQLRRAASRKNRAGTACRLAPLSWRGVFEKVRAAYLSLCSAKGEDGKG
jgi:glycosyltransferase involved in cell wall biosynthesis